MLPSLLISSRVSAFTKLNRILKGTNFQSSKFFIIVDENSYNYCLPTLIANVEALENAEFFEIPIGEEAKSLEVAAQLWGALMDSGADRESVIVNLGGGCVCDLGGFVAAGYKRGIRYINVPTTLVGMVDAAIGGKTAVNMENTKNQVGFFWQPDAVCINPDFLDTLPEDELQNGMFEVVKTLFLSDKKAVRDLLVRLSSSDYYLLTEMKGRVADCASFKESVVKADATEQSVRKILNFGHTFGHGIESFAMERGVEMKHGVAVGIGMACELYLSVKKMGLDARIMNEYCDMLRTLVEIPHFTLADTEVVLKYMRRDKKNRDGLILCVLLQDYSVPVIDVAISENEVRDALLQIAKQ